MKGFFEWFKSSTKMKRWFLMIVIGIVLCCYGFSKILIEKELLLEELVWIIAAFVVGFIFVVLGIIFIQKRTLELLVQANSTVVGEKNVNIQSLIFNKNVYEEGPKVVVIGGGTGLNTVLEGIKKYTNNITAIVTVSDYGKKATNSRKELDLLPLEDIKDGIIALADNEEEMKKIMNYHFRTNQLMGLSFGDIYMLATKELYGNMAESIQKSSNILKITGKVLPATLDEINICAELKDGTIVEEREKISDITYHKATKINRIYITPSNCIPAPGVLEAIKEADAIIIGPGSLYTNVIPNLLVKNVAKTIKESKAFKIYVSNIMTEPGQTDNYSISEHIQAIIDHAGGKIIDYCICDTGEVVPEYIRKYNKQGSDLVEIDLSKVSNLGVNVIHKHMSRIEGEKIRHDADTVAVAIMELICTDLKFKDQQYDTKYILLNSKLKDQKKQEKKKEKVQKRKTESGGD